MKTLKIILTVLLTIIIVVVGFATEILALINISIINPWFYEKALSNSGFYDNVRLIMVSQINTFVDEQENIPEDFKEDAYKITESVFSQDKFSKQIGDFIGGSVKYVLYDEGDPVIPLGTWISDFNNELDSSTLVEDIVNANIENGTVTESDRDSYHEALNINIHDTYTGFLNTFTSLLEGSNTLDGFIRAFYSSEKVYANIVAQFNQFKILAKWAKQGMYGGIAALIILSALLLLLWKKDIGKAYKLLGVVFIINSIILVIIGGFMLMSISILDVMNKLPAILVSFKGIAQSGINSFAVLVLIGGAIVLAIGITLSILGGALLRKKEDVLAEEIDTIDTQVSEIVYEEKQEEIISEEDTE